MRVEDEGECGMPDVGDSWYIMHSVKLLHRSPRTTSSFASCTAIASFSTTRKVELRLPRSDIVGQFVVTINTVRCKHLRPWNYPRNNRITAEKDS